MAYSDFTLKKVKYDFSITTVENTSLFPNINGLEVSEYLLQTLKKNVPLALAINTEKARSELIIINVLLEVRTQLNEKISLFSGIDFNVDKEKGLNGFCDYILSRSEEQLYLDIPIITIVEAKNENIVSGLGQCIAEMYAAQLYNGQSGHNIPCIHGAVTTGNEWRFVKLLANTAYIDNIVYYISDINKIISILVKMSQMHS